MLARCADGLGRRCGRDCSLALSLWELNLRMSSISTKIESMCGGIGDLDV